MSARANRTEIQRYFLFCPFCSENSVHVYHDGTSKDFALCQSCSALWHVYVSQLTFQMKWAELVRIGTKGKQELVGIRYEPEFWRNMALTNHQLHPKSQISDQQVELQLQKRERKIELIKNYELAGRYEDAARLCDELEMWEKAGELRRMAKTSYLISTTFSMGKDGAISVNCPNCGSTQVVESKSNMVSCQHCGNNYIIPKKVLDMM